MSSDESSLLSDVLASATAGVLSRAVTHPLDTAKARLQAPGRPTLRGPLSALLRTYRREGLRALYGGFGAVIVGGTPGTVLYLTSYAYFRDALSSASARRRGAASAGEEADASPSRGGEFAVYLSSGMLAEVVACVIYVPVDVVKERMQVQQNPDAGPSKGIAGQGTGQNYNYRGSFHALRQIVRTEGLRGVYKVVLITFQRLLGYSCVFWTVFCLVLFVLRMLKRMPTRAKQGRGRAPYNETFLAHLVACSAGAGALAAWLTSPLDMAKLRLQVRRGNLAGAPGAPPPRRRTTRYGGMVDGLRAAYEEGGSQGLFRGAGARVLHVAGATTVTMTCYEEFRLLYAGALSVST